MSNDNGKLQSEPNLFNFDHDDLDLGLSQFSQLPLLPKK